jgi:hypothetical protein
MEMIGKTVTRRLSWLFTPLLSKTVPIFPNSDRNPLYQYRLTPVEPQLTIR